MRRVNFDSFEILLLWLFYSMDGRLEYFNFFFFDSFRLFRTFYEFLNIFWGYFKSIWIYSLNGIIEKVFDF